MGIEELKLGLQAINLLAVVWLGLAARNKVALKMNVPAARLDAVVGLLPSLHAPTVSHLYDRDWLALETVVDSRLVRDLIPRLTAAGAQGVLEYELKKMV